MGLFVAAIACSAGVGCRRAELPAPGATAVFTPAHATVGAALRDFFNIRPSVVQPFPFPHKTHAEKKLGCTEYCHEAVTQGPRAGLPSVSTCMGCHEWVATDRPRIQELMSHAKRGLDFTWARVYAYPAQSHVRFHHAAHVRKDIACATCHGPIEQQGVAERNVDVNMGFCVNCHTAKGAPNECVTCHY